MFPRRMFRVVLGLLALPLFLVANTGCDVVFDLDRAALEDNALRCECECDSTGNQRDVIVQASADDAEQTGATMEITGPDLDLGERVVGLRFDKAMIPRGVVVTSAFVQFVSNETLGGATTNLTIVGEYSTAAPAFTLTDNDLTSRTEGAASVGWAVPDWNAGNAGPAQLTPNLKDIIQELVDQSGWSIDSPVVLRFEGSGHRAARSFDGNAGSAPALIVTHDATVEATLPVCALDGVAVDADNRITPDGLVGECTRVQATFTDLAAACGYPTPCRCSVVDAPDQDDSFQSNVCSGGCPETPLEDACTNFDPNAFADCVASTLDVDDCKHLVAATNVTGDSPVCVTAGSPIAFEAFGRRSLCAVDGTSEIHVGDREPQHDPATGGTVEILGGPCVGGGCSVYPYFDLAMDDITFSVRFHSDPTFGDLSASGHALETAAVVGVEASFAGGAVEGTGNGRRDADALAVTGANASPLVLGLDWAAHACDMNGNLVSDVDAETPDGLCDGDDATVCTQDSPDCDEAGGPCILEAEAVEQMAVNVHLTGTLVNQPPLADAGDDQVLECTSPDGALITLDGRDSSDPNGDLTLASWRQGNRVGPEVSTDLRTVQTVGVGATEPFVLRVIDSYAQTDEDEAEAGVVDTTPPVIACNAPATVPPSSHTVVYTATATDICDADVPATIVDYSCFKINGNGTINDKTKNCKITVEGGTITIRNKGGNGDHIQWTVQAADDTGNPQQIVCEVLVQS